MYVIFIVGEIGTSDATATCFVEYWNLQSIHNIINNLKENGGKHLLELYFLIHLCTIHPSLA